MNALDLVETVAHQLHAFCWQHQTLRFTSKPQPDFVRVFPGHDIASSEYNQSVPDPSPLQKVVDHLRLYDHPLLAFSARENNGVIEVLIDLKNSSIPVHTYVLPMHPRDLDHPQFAWHLQRQLYDGLHDYFIEMFTHTPQDSAISLGKAGI